MEIKELLNNIFNIEVMKVLLPFLACIFTFAFTYYFLRRFIIKSNKRFVSYTISFVVTLIAYFSFIFIFGLKRYDYVFDFLRVVGAQLSNVCASSIVLTQILESINVAQFQLYEVLRENRNFLHTFKVKELSILFIYSIFIVKAKFHTLLLVFEKFTIKDISIKPQVSLLENVKYNC